MFPKFAPTRYLEYEFYFHRQDPSPSERKNDDERLTTMQSNEELKKFYVPISENIRLAFHPVHFQQSPRSVSKNQIHDFELANLNLDTRTALR